ncbi:MoaD/ThiS family protein [Cryobacterium melibiosiphilum]|uniref:MoaD/ThiS family protein n=2 Tax=Cryobacterium melibiosiphilum TaxID=995039 RepID=A0A3A5N0M5_9MICO|nr:MoaD/ThiS family protein [Cryobacterium melibiosiphilum]
MVSIRFFAGAAEAAGTESLNLETTTVGALRHDLVERFGPDFARILGLCALLVNGTRAADDATPLPEAATVDVLPPFAGG